MSHVVDALAVLATALEWAALGWLAGMEWPCEAPFVVRWSLRLMGGAALLGFTLLVLGLVAIPLTLVPVVLAAAAVLAALARVLVFRPRRVIAAARPGSGELWAWAILGLVLAGACLRSWLVPEAGWDAYSDWGLRAKAFALGGAIVPAQTAHEYYPPVVSLLEAWLDIQRGLVSIDLVKVQWAILGSAFAVVLGWHLHAVLRPRWTAPLASLGILAVTPQLLQGFWTGQADLPLAAFLTLGALALFRWQSARPAEERAWLAQAGVFLGAASLMKFEGIYRVALVLGVLALEGLLRRAPRRWALAALALTATSLGALVPWLLFRQLHAIPVSAEHLVMPRWADAPSVMGALLATFGGVRAGAGILVGGLGLLLAARRLFRAPLRFLALVSLVQAAATVLAFFTSSTAPATQVLTSANRLVLQFEPVLLFAIAAAIGQGLAEPAAAADGESAPTGGEPEPARA